MRRILYYSEETAPLPEVVEGPAELYGGGVPVHRVPEMSEIERHRPLGVHETKPPIIGYGIYEPLRW